MIVWGYRMRDLFAGIPVGDFKVALDWYNRFLGKEPSFFPHEKEAVWELAEHRYIYIVQDQENAGHALVTCLVDDLESFVGKIDDLAIKPSKDEAFPNNMRKLTYRDPDGNEFGIGGVVQNV